jgi:hypothetical protein
VQKCGPVQHGGLLGRLAWAPKGSCGPACGKDACQKSGPSQKAGPCQKDACQKDGPCQKDGVRQK